jgi:hypothetical protein
MPEEREENLNKKRQRILYRLLIGLALGELWWWFSGWDEIYFKLRSDFA